VFVQAAQLEHCDIIVVQRELTPAQAAAARFPTASAFMADARARAVAAAELDAKQR
jgi:hypothetical protein